MAHYVDEDSLDLLIPSASSAHSSDVSFLDADSSTEADDYLSPMVIEHEWNAATFIHSPRPKTILPPPIFDYRSHIFLHFNRVVEFSELSPIQELPELIYESVKIMNFNQCMAVEKKRIRTIRYKRQRQPIQLQCDIASEPARRRDSDVGDHKGMTVKRRKRTLLTKCIKWAFACIA